MKRTSVTYEFVEFIPSELGEGTLYISTTYATAAHLCACGCRNKVVTPLSSVEWKLIYDGDSVSLHPSIGNWEFTCRSHYWIRHNKILWARAWTDCEIAKGRRQDAEDLASYFSGEETDFDVSSTRSRRRRKSILDRLRRLIRLR